MATIERRVRKSGPPSWRVTVRMREPISRRIVQQRKTFRRKTDAQRWADEQERLIRTGAMSPATDWTVSQLIDGWLADALPLLKGERHRRDRELQAEWWRERLGEARVGEVSPALVSRILDTLDCSVARRNRIKNGRPRAAPMLPTARSRLLARRQLRRIDTDLVFAGPAGRPRFPRKAWTEAVEAAKLDASASTTCGTRQRATSR